MFQKLSLKLRILISIGSVVLITFITTNAFTIMNISKATKDEAIDKMKEISFRYGDEAQEEIEHALDSARLLAQNFEAIRSFHTPDRNQLNAVLKKTLEENPSFLGVCTAWEPNALDGQDVDYVSKPGHDQTGRFIPYWNRDGDRIKLDPLTDYETAGVGDWYLIPRKTGEETIVNPFLYEISGKNVLMTTLGVPIKQNGVFLGITGVDLALDTLQQMITKIKPYGSGYASLFANNLTYAADSDSKQLGKKIESQAVSNAIQEVIKSDLPKVLIEENDLKLNAATYQVLIPIHIGNTKTPWVFLTAVPVNKVMERINQISLMSITFTIIALVLLILIVLYVTRGIVNPLHRIMLAINQGAMEVSSASLQLLSSSQQLSEGSAEQASSIEETSSTLQESATMLQQNNVNTKQAAQLSANTLNAAGKGHQEMQNMMNAIKDIKQSSDQIAKIIKVIDNIAFQTNILALNAAVEAARAGEAGMGFAVVAEEVRNLAQRSAQAAKDTTAMIETNIGFSANGVSAAEKVREDLNEIMTQVKKVSEIMDEIAAASQEHSQGIEQVNKAMNQMEIVTQQNASTAEESASASEELNAQAENMRIIASQLSELVNGKGSKELEQMAEREIYQSNKDDFAKIKLMETQHRPLSKPQAKLAGPDGMKTKIVSPNEIITLGKDNDF